MRAPNLSSVSYFANQCPPDPIDIPRFLNEELLRLQSAIAALALGHVDKTHVEPSKPRDGDIRYADGTDWDPGSGQGIYHFQDTAWVPLF